MTPTNAIAKVRFSSAKAQRVHLAQCEGLAAELLCLEGGQQLRIKSEAAVLYIILGTAEVSAGDQTVTLQTGYVFAPGTAFTLANAGEHRLVCLTCQAA
ncbi:MAG: cupin domain-containing protein [Planctomycetes bacterium]|nr:cupin domain-containing protein [Planctomycetota bacterium]